MREIFPEGTIIPAFRRPKNLKEMLARSFSLKTEKANYDCFKCNRKCDLCVNYFKDSNCFSSFSTGKIYLIKHNPNQCSSRNVIFLASCTRYKLQYVGSTSTQFQIRFRNHKSAMLTKKNTCESYSFQ